MSWPLRHLATTGSYRKLPYECSLFNIFNSRVSPTEIFGVWLTPASHAVSSIPHCLACVSVSRSFMQRWWCERPPSNSSCHAISRLLHSRFTSASRHNTPTSIDHDRRTHTPYIHQNCSTAHTHYTYSYICVGVHIRQRAVLILINPGDFDARNLTL